MQKFPSKIYTFNLSTQKDPVFQINSLFSQISAKKLQSHTLFHFYRFRIQFEDDPKTPSPISTPFPRLPHFTLDTYLIIPTVKAKRDKAFFFFSL